MYPTTVLELVICTLIMLVGSVIIGTIIGEFSNILAEISRKSKQINEEFDMLTLIMYNLRVPEKVQTRVFKYYEERNMLKFVKHNEFYNYLNERLTKTVKLF